MVECCALKDLGEFERVDTVTLNQRMALITALEFSHYYLNRPPFSEGMPETLSILNGRLQRVYADLDSFFESGGLVLNGYGRYSFSYDQAPLYSFYNTQAYLLPLRLEPLYIPLGHHAREPILV